MNKRYGCSSYFKLRDYQNHYSNCNYILNKFMYFKNSVFEFSANAYIVNEIKKICILVQCSSCFKFMDLLDLNDHFVGNCNIDLNYNDGDYKNLKLIDDGDDEESTTFKRSISNKNKKDNNNYFNMIFDNIRINKIKEEIKQIDTNSIKEKDEFEKIAIDDD